MKILFDLKSKLVVPIRIKLFIALIIITLAIIFGFSYTIFQTATQFFLESYLNNKLAIAKIAATTFNGSKHENWGKITSIGNPEFETARDEFKRILSLSDKTRYLYSVNYDKQKDQFFYVLTGGTVSENTIWVETTNFAFQIIFNEKQKISLQYYEKRFNDSFYLKVNENLSYDVKVKENSVYVNDELFFEMKDFSKKIAKIGNDTFTITNSKIINFKSKQNRNYQVYFTFQGDYDTVPGAAMNNSDKFTNAIRKQIRENKDEIDLSTNSDSYGSYYSVRAIIRNKLQEPIGVVILEISEDEILIFKDLIKSKLYLVTLFILVILFIIVFILATVISKPIKTLMYSIEEFSRGNFKHKVLIRSGDEFESLGLSFNKMAENILEANEKISNYAENLEKLVEVRTLELNKTLKIIEADLLLAKKIQENSINIEITDRCHLKVAPIYLPKSVVGGDFYTVNKLNNHTYRFFLADATGHGIQGAMLTMAIKGIYDNLKDFEINPSEILEIFNNEFLERYYNLNSYLTCILVEIDVVKNLIRYSSAGHPSRILVNDTKTVFLEKTGKLIGLIKNVKYNLVEHEFRFGDRLFLFTDGMFEEFDDKKIEFGEKNLVSIIENCSSQKLESVVLDCLRSLREFLGDSTIQDDITLIGIEYK